MSDSKKKRMSMLDNLAAAAPAAPSMMSTNRALRSARDAVDGHSLWDLDPEQIDLGDRIHDRLDMNDLIDLRDAIEANGQTVPILVRRHPSEPDRYLLVYGRRRLEAIRSSDKVDKVRALIANMDDTAAITAQVSENIARRDLTFIERALFARELIDQGFGSQSKVAEVLTVTRSSVSMALAIIDMVTPDLARAIGSAQGIGRPRWEALGKGIAAIGADTDSLMDLAIRTHDQVEAQIASGHALEEYDGSVVAFNAVMDQVTSEQPKQALTKAKPAPSPLPGRTLTGAARIRRTGAGLRLDVAKGEFADWLEAEADTIFQELHDRWKSDV